MSFISDRAWVTYLCNSQYLNGCLVLAYSLRKVESRYRLVVMVPSSLFLKENSSQSLREKDLAQLNSVSNIVVKPIDVKCWDLSDRITADDDEYLWDYYADTWPKLGAWGLTEYKRLVLMDCDMLVMKNMDQLLNERPDFKVEEIEGLNHRKAQLGHRDAYLDLPHGWVAASHACTCNPLRNPRYPASWTPDSCAYTQYTGNPCPPSHNRVPQSESQGKTEQLINDSDDVPAVGMPPKRSYFNTGLVVLTPTQDQFNDILATFRSIKSLSQYTFPDQDLLNEVYAGRWRSIGYGYNALKTLSFAHSPIWKEDSVVPPASHLNDAASVAADANRVSAGGSVMPVFNIHYILEKPWNVPDLDKAEQESNKFVEMYRWWWQAYDEQLKETDT
ncbi:hypothetical protein BGZ80_002382 [Entomortierella chlamydospora]|uniref:Glycosyltransferase family 8 protein n=1 Tax=Entomortierella chlamydospora TaxID=101097 RepID=A0A9P6MPX2_9FUNG|nr:hypothetical protein BGZ79_001914 [Entomortierella chlamydospora]KAG0009444.1 hypothetical protein BGZ80_002382 [Entomortierella chlamydospora]